MNEINPPETSFHPSKAEWERLLNRVLESTPFRRSTRLRDFLIYVGNEVILHGAEDLHEHQIGTAVFGRPPLYDTSQDNIVRVNAMELRKRIDLYFSEEGQSETLVFEVPRGSYIPVFRLRSPIPVDQLVAPHMEQTSALDAFSAPVIQDTPRLIQEKNSSQFGTLISPVTISLLAIIVFLTAGLGIVVWRNRLNQVALHRWQSGPALSAFWGNFFGKGLAPEIVLADSSFALAQDILHNQMSLAQYLDYSYRAVQSPNQLSDDARQQEQRDLAVIFDRSSGSLGDFRVARRITELETGEYGTRLLFAREYTGHRLRWNNTIFVGSDRSNPWVDLYEDRISYHFKPAQDHSPALVTVDNPTGTEKAEYFLPSDPSARTAYCVVVFLPNPTNTGNTLILAGSDSQATEAGGDFLTSEEGLERLRTVLRQKTFPYFQVLLRISNSNGTPLGSEIVSYRIIKK